MEWWRRIPEPSRGTRALGLLLGAMVLSGPMAVPTVRAVGTPRRNEWHINAMRLPDAWKLSQGAGVTVAVIDGGVAADRPDLVGQVLPARDFSPHTRSSTLAEQLSHGTGMASLIAGTGRGLDGQGTIGVAPGARILPLRVINDDLVVDDVVGGKRFDGLMAEAIRYAADSSARVINISQGTRYPSAGLESAVRYALSKGELIFAAVGNEAREGDPVEYPAAITGVVGVGALDEKGYVTRESETGQQVALVAPGQDMIEACTSSTGYCLSHGTSDATAVVSGVAALVWARHPEWSADQVLRVLIDTAQGPADGSRRNDQVGYGLVRPRIALQRPGDPGPAHADPPAHAHPPAPAAGTLPAGSPARRSRAAGTAARAATSSGRAGPWIAGIAVLAVLGAAGVTLLRRRIR